MPDARKLLLWMYLFLWLKCLIHFISLVGERLSIGFTTRATLNRLLDAGDVTPQQAEKFQQAELAFLVRAVEYAMEKLSLRETLLRQARFVDVQ